MDKEYRSTDKFLSDAKFDNIAHSISDLKKQIREMRKDIKWLKKAVENGTYSSSS